MSPKYQQTKEELEQHLKNVQDALILSSDAYDAGYNGEASRLAAAIRVLVHETPGSHALLGQLGLDSNSYWTSAIPRDPKQVGSSFANVALFLPVSGNQGRKAADYVAPLDRIPDDAKSRWVSLDEWWNEVIFVDTAGRESTRKTLILAVANTDGGVHVDPKLGATYAACRVRMAWGGTLTARTEPVIWVGLKRPRCAKSLMS